MILNLVAPLTKKSIYKVPSQREAWGSLPYFWSHYSSWLFSREFSENIFLRGKRRTNPDLIYQLGNLTLGAERYLYVGTSSGGSWLKPGSNPSHGWVERASSQVISSSNTEVRVCLWIVNAGYLSVQFSSIKGASIYMYEALGFLFHFLEVNAG